MALNVEAYQKEKVKPSSPTPETLRIHKLSLVDILVGTLYSPFIFFYHSGAGSGRHDYDKFKESLSKTLSVLYPLAGRLRDDGPTTIECNDEGADLVLANVTNYDLAEFLRHPKLDQLRQLLPLDPYPDAIDPAAHPMLGVQVNRFRGGGTAVAFCTWHGVADGAAMGGLFNTLAAINYSNRREEGATNSGGGLVVDASPIFPPGNFNSYRVVPAVMAGLKKDLGKYSTKRFVISKQDMERIRSQCEHRRPSRVAALSAFIWAAVIRATLLVNPMLKVHLLTHIVNLRNKLNPPLPSQCLGNILSEADAKWEGEQITARSLVRKVVKSIDKFTNDYVREMQEAEGGFLRSILAQAKIKGETKTLNISSLCKLPFGELDFGWGKPIWIGVAHSLLDTALYLDTKDGGVEVWIWLEHEVMRNLNKDMEFQAYVSFADMVSESSSPRLSCAL